MKFNNAHLISLFLSLFFCFGAMLWTDHVAEKKMKLMNDSIRRLVMIEIISKQQFDLLTDKVERLERMNGRIGMKD